MHIQSRASRRHRSALAGVVILACLAPSAPVAGAEAPKPSIDAQAAVRASFNFMRDREPELTETEYALYQRVIPMVTVQPEFAIRLLEGMTAQAETSAAFDLALGNVYYEQKRHDDAEGRYRAALKKHPEFLRAWDNLGILFFSTERYADAVPCFSKVVSLGGREGRIFGLLGYCLARSGNPIAAEMAYMQACVLEPDNAEWLEGHLQILLQTSQYSRAEGLLRQLTRLKPGEEHHWVLLANVLIAQDRRLDAIVVLDLAAGLGVLSGEGFQLMGDLAAGARFFPEAVRAYRLLAERDPKIGTERMLRFAHALAETGDLDRAGNLIGSLEQAVPPTGPARVDFLEAKAAWLRAQGDDAQARVVFEALLGLEPLHGVALMNLAEIQEAQGEEARAVFTLESAARVPEVAHLACLRLAQLEVRDRDYRGALALLEKALNLQESPLVREYLAQVKALAVAHE